MDLMISSLTDSMRFHELSLFRVCHRLSSLMHADEILFLEGGRVVERGSHQELIATSGSYRAMYELQIRQGPADSHDP